MKLYDGKKYHIVTFGCQMNVHESEKIAGGLVSLGMTQCSDINSSDVIVFNTCCIREGAEDRAFSNIAALKSLKQKNKDLIIILCGCMPQQDNGKYDFKTKLPFVDIILGTFNTHLIPHYLTEFASNKKRIFKIEPKHYDNEDLLPSVRDDNINAYVNIVYGCNNFCTYCVVPYVRGRERSRPMKDIVDEFKTLSSAGYRYITLLGQNVNSYGKDLKPAANFAELLKKLCDVEGDFKIKFLTSHPKDLTDDVISVIAAENKIAKHLHLPVQSGSDKILNLMNRHYNLSHYNSIIKKLRKLSSDITFSTDIIVGFPGETHSDFMKTVKLVKKVKYSQIFAFMFSKRKGTKAFDFDNQISDEVKNLRVNYLLKIQKNINSKQTAKLLGKTFNVLISKLNDEYIGLTDSGKTLHINARILKDNSFTDVVVTSIDNAKIYAKLK